MRLSNISYPKISVIICTYNRVELLKGILTTLIEQDLECDHFEVIVVDNNSTDSTKEATLRLIENYSNFHYCLETKVGLSHARNRGCNDAKGIYVAYLDDDCQLPSGFLSVANRIINDIKPDVFGGPYNAFFNSPKPDWFKEKYGSHFTYPEARFINERPEVLHGLNLIIKKNLLKSIGGFNPDLGMIGDKIAYGEETAVIRSIKHNFPESRFYYDPELYVYHLVRENKMQWKWILNSSFSTGKYNFHVFGSALSFIGKTAKSCALFLLILLGIPRTIFGLVFRSRKTFPYYQQYLYESSLIYLKYWGWIYEHLTGSETNRTLSKDG